MISESRMFPKAVTLSIAAHIAILGSALAFAQYAGGVFRNSGTVITLSLVSGGGEAVRKPGMKTARTMPVDAMEPAFPVKEITPVPAEDVQSGEKAAPKTDSEGANSATPGQGEGPGQTVTSGADSGTGALSSEQWTQLHSALEQVKTYPRLARERGIEGTVLVRFKVLPSGDIDGVKVVKSSGAAVLDEASVRTVYRAAPMPYVSGWVEVPMSYVLK